MSVRSFFAWGLILGGGYCAYRGAEDYFQSVEGQKSQAAVWRKQPAQEESLPRGIARNRPPRRSALAPGSSLAKLSIPRLNSTLYVVEGTADRDLTHGPGHLEGTVEPGAAGNCVIAGHRDTHFRILKNIHKGDEIVVQSRAGTYRYRVSGVSVVPPDNTMCLRPTSTAVLNLVTCFPFEYVGTAPRRFIVHADLMS